MRAKALRQVPPRLLWALTGWKPLGIHGVTVPERPFASLQDTGCAEKWLFPRMRTVKSHGPSPRGNVQPPGSQPNKAGLPGARSSVTCADPPEAGCAPAEEEEGGGGGVPGGLAGSSSGRHLSWVSKIRVTPAGLPPPQHLGPLRGTAVPPLCPVGWHLGRDNFHRQLLTQRASSTPYTVESPQ